MKVDHSTIARWVLTYAPQIEEKTRRHLKLTNESWRVDETYIEVKRENGNIYIGQKKREGNTIDFMLSVRRNKKAASAILQKSPKSQT